MDIREMKAGRELDLKIAEEVFRIPFESLFKGVILLKPYSTDISAAWEVVEKMKSRVDSAFGYYLAECIGLTTGMDIWVKENMPDSYSLATWAADLVICELMEKLTPEAICKAALLAMEDKA
jgi:hypothetical protein